MSPTTLTALIAICAILVLMLVRPDVRARGTAATRHCHASPRAVHRPTRVEPFPRLSRNHWVRTDLARMLRTDDDFAGRISPPTGADRDKTS